MPQHSTSALQQWTLRLRYLLIAVQLLVPAIFAQTSQPPSGSVEQLWAEAAAAQNRQEYSQAAAIYKRILQQQPGFFEAEVNLGLMLQLSGDLSDATAHFEHVLLRHPDLFAPNLLAGMNHLKLDQPDRALPELQAAVRLAPDKLEARLGLGDAYLQLKKYSQAVEQFIAATHVDGRNAEAWNGLGAAYLSMERDEEFELRHTQSPYRTILLAQSYVEQGKTDKAIDSLHAVVSTAPDLPCVHSILGFALLESSRFDEARKQFALDWNGSSGGCLLSQLGLVALDAKQGRVQDALRVLAATRSIDAAFVRANAGLYLNSLAAAGAENDARQIIDSAPEPKMAAAPANPLQAMRKGRYSACSSELATSARSDVASLHALAFCSFYTGQDERVLAATGKIPAKSPADPEALYWRIQSIERMGMHALTTAMEIDPNSASLHTLMGDLLYAKGDLAEAAAEYRKAVALKPGFLAAHIALARALNSDHKTEEAEQEIRSVLNANSNDPEANYLMGEILVNRSRYSDALPYLLHAQHASPDELPYVHADLSKIYEEQGQVDHAIAELKLAAPVDVDGSYHYRLGHLYLRAGDRSAAKEALQVAEDLRHQTDVNSLYQK